MSQTRSRKGHVLIGIVLINSFDIHMGKCQILNQYYNLQGSTLNSRLYIHSLLHAITRLF